MWAVCFASPFRGIFLNKISLYLPFYHDWLKLSFSLSFKYSLLHFLDSMVSGVYTTSFAVLIYMIISLCHLTLAVLSFRHVIANGLWSCFLQDSIMFSLNTKMNLLFSIGKFLKKRKKKLK